MSFSWWFLKRRLQFDGEGAHSCQQVQPDQGANLSIVRRRLSVLVALGAVMLAVAGFFLLAGLEHAGIGQQPLKAGAVGIGHSTTSTAAPGQRA